MNLTSFKHIFWKDWKQIQTPVLVIAALLCSVQILVIILTLTTNRQNVPVPPLNYNLILIVPLMAGAVIAGTMISQERGRRTWDWSSSLPVPWHLNLLSQYCNWFLALALIWLPMFALASVLSITHGDFSTFVNLFVNFLLIGLELVIWLSILMLIFRDSVTGMLLGLILFAGYAIASSAICPIIIWHNEQNKFLEMDQFLVPIALAIRGTVLALGIIIGLRLYRWRWTTGQDYQFNFAGLGGNVATIEPQPQAWNVAVSPGKPLGHLKMIMAHGARNVLVIQLTLIGIFFASSLLFWPLTQVVGSKNSAYTFGILLLFGGILPTCGIMAFSPDQYGNRYRFMADRGVAPIAFAGIRIAIALATATLLVLYAWFFYGNIGGTENWRPAMTPSSLWTGMWYPAIAVTSLGIFSSLCFIRTPMAFVVTCFSAAIGTMLYLMFVQPWMNLVWPNYYLGRTSEFYYSTVGSVIATITLLMFSFAGVRCWLTTDRFAGGRWFICGWLTALFASIVCVIAISLSGLD